MKHTRTDQVNDTDHEAHDIVIVGGGMVGLSLACMLSKALPQLSITLLDAHPVADQQRLYQSSFDARSTALSSASIDIYKTLGIWSAPGDSPAIATHATPIKTVHVSDRGHLGQVSYEDTENAGAALGYVVENSWLGACLSKATASYPRLTILAPAQVDDIRVVPGGAKLSVATEKGHSALSARLVIIADGAGSKLGAKLGIGVETHSYRQSAVIANVEFDVPHNCVAYERFTAQGPLAMLPLGEGPNARRAALVWTWPEGDVDAVKGWDDRMFLARLQRSFGYRLGNLTRVSKRVVYPLSLMLAREQVRSSLVLVGNAAHFLHPVAGQGFNLALRDCAKLTAVLASADTNAASLGSISTLSKYADGQRFDQQATIAMSHGFTRVFSSDNPVNQAVRNLGLVGLGVCAPAKTVFFNQMMGRSAIVG